MADTVLVTGGFGLVGSATVRQLAADGRRVVIADLETPANAKKAKALPQGVAVRWADLTDADQVQRLVSEVAPVAIIHLAAIIAPAIYRMPKVARTGQRGSDGDLGSGRRGATVSATIRPCVEQRGLRPPQPAPHS